MATGNGTRNLAGFTGCTEVNGRGPVSRLVLGRLLRRPAQRGGPGSLATRLFALATAVLTVLIGLPTAALTVSSPPAAAGVLSGPAGFTGTGAPPGGEYAKAPTPPKVLPPSGKPSGGGGVKPLVTSPGGDTLNVSDVVVGSFNNSD